MKRKRPINMVDGRKRAFLQMAISLIFGGFLCGPTLGQSTAKTRLQPFIPPMLEMQELERLISQERSTRDLLSFLERLAAAGELERLGGDRLAFSNWNFSGWRREFITGGERVILAGDGALLVAIRESETIELSVTDLSHGNAVERGYAASARYFGHTSSGTQHVTAMSANHFSNKAPELFKIYYYFAGPTRTIVNSRALPPAVIPL